MALDKIDRNTSPKIVSFYELRRVLLPYIAGLPWAEDALMDLWQMGAPDPSPGSVPCPPNTCQAQRLGGSECGKWGCRKIKRILLPAQFATWWRDVSARDGVELSAEQALKGRRN